MGEHKSVKAILAEQDHRALATWAADCAGHVLPSFEKMVPHDDRPRKAIEAARLWVQGALPMVEARKAAFAAHAAARDAQDVTAQLAARAAGHAAATAHVADHARHAAEYALKAVASAKSSGGAPVAEQDWQYQHLPEHLRPAIFPSPVSGDPPMKAMI